MIYTYKAKKLQSCMSTLLNIQLLAPYLWITGIISIVSWTIVEWTFVAWSKVPNEGGILDSCCQDRCCLTFKV